MKHFFSVASLIGLCFTSLMSYAQFAPAVGIIGTTAMYKDSLAFVDWANAGSVVRGYQDISNPNLGFVNVGDSSSAFGMAGSNGVVSLGDAGYAILQFTSPVVDGIGPDFAVFENSFNDTFLELAVVEVSSDGIYFFRFPATSNSDTTIQTGAFDATDASLLNNLAGKYRGLYGTPFDIADIPNNTLLNKQAITHIKVLDVVGSINNQYCTRDINQHKINDPWPTAFGSSGFDLDAIGIIHNQTNVGINELQALKVQVFPNPVVDVLHVITELNSEYTLSITNLFGQEVKKNTHLTSFAVIDLKDVTEGVYILTIQMATKKQVLKFVKS